MRTSALQQGYTELEISGRHVIAVAGLPPIHKDPFDRLLIAQAMVEGITLLTADAMIARYPGPIRKV
jgi:PIN domain nuclease of toxin-antitoxin system